MGVLSAIPIIGDIIDKGLGIVDDLVPDKDLANKLKTRIKQQIEQNSHEKDLEQIRAQAGVIKAEATGESWLQRNWRPVLMLVITVIVANNYVLFPYMSLFTSKATMLDLPPELWNLLKIGVGGYIVGRSAEKVTRSIKGR